MDRFTGILDPELDAESVGRPNIFSKQMTFPSNRAHPVAAAFYVAVRARVPTAGILRTPRCTEGFPRRQGRSPPARRPTCGMLDQ